MQAASGDKSRTSKRSVSGDGRGEQPGAEFALIARHFQNLDVGEGVVLGNGDDAALLSPAADEQVAVSVDAMLEGVHFPANSAGHRVAYRAVAAAASDLAAMGARPLAMTIALSMPSIDEDWVSDFRSGLQDAKADLDLPLVGGDLVQGPLSVTVQVVGAVRASHALRRGGARVGENIYVSGTLGDAAAGLAIAKGQLVIANAEADRYLRERFWRPTVEFRLGRALLGIAGAAIDISDGLLADLRHVAQASGVHIAVDSSRLPISDALKEIASADQALQWALAGGEDYRLCFSAAADADLPPHCVMIGQVEPGEGVSCDAAVVDEGYVHFSSQH